MTDAREIHKEVREGYARVARGSGSCCSAPGADAARAVGRAIGYSDGEMAAAPAGSNLGLGCGNPVGLASLREGETVLDLGSGAGFDCFLAAARVGPRGRVIGVDMTAEMLDRARANAAKGGRANVEFRLGEIENLPVADGAVDAVISNCVINLSPDKPRVFREAHRALRPGGRLLVSDIVLLADLPPAVRESVAAHVACLAGAMAKEDYLAAIRGAGFADVTVVAEDRFPAELLRSDPTVAGLASQMNLNPREVEEALRSVVSLKVSARKPLPPGASPAPRRRRRASPSRGRARGASPARSRR